MPCDFSRSAVLTELGDRALDPVLDLRELVDEEVCRRARADADPRVVDDVPHRFAGDGLLLLVLRAIVHALTAGHARISASTLAKYAVKRAAAAPSITRWSYDSDSGSIRRGTNALAVPDRLHRALRHAEDRDFRRVDDRRERGAADAAERADREASALHVGRAELAFARLRRQLADLASRSAARPSCRRPAPPARRGRSACRRRSRC